MPGSMLRPQRHLHDAFLDSYLHDNLTMRLATDPSRGWVVVVTLRRKVPTWHQE